MTRDKYNRRWVSAMVVLVLLSSCIACVEESQEEGVRGAPTMVSRGMITASFNRYVAGGSDDPFEHFGLTGVFARFDPEAPTAIDLLWDSPPSGVDLALDSCTMPTPVLDQAGHQDPHRESTVELLDVGDLSVSFGGVKKPVPTRTFPDLLKVIVGVTYAADETQGVVFQPGETYEVRSEGTSTVDRFRVALDAPEDLGVVTVDGVAPGDQLPVISSNSNIALAWEGDGYGDEVIANLNWTSMGSPWQIVCRMRDDGFFVIPEAVTAGLPDPLTSSDEEISLQRIRQVAFRSANLSSGAFKFVVSTNFAISF